MTSVFIDHCLSFFCPILFGHCIVCPSIYYCGFKRRQNEAILETITAYATIVCHNLFSKAHQRQEAFEDTKGVIKITISKKNRQINGQKKKDKRTNKNRVSLARFLTGTHP